MLTRTFLKTIETRQLIREDDRVLVGVSGGADSVALLVLLTEFQSRWSIKISVAHLNHGIRGAEADEDERFVTRLAKHLGVRCIAERAEVPAMARQRGWSLEMAAREARYEFFRRAAGMVRARAVVLAHTLDDQVETVLLRLVRGAGARGLGGMEYLTEQSGLTVIRPLLDIRHDDLLAYLRRKRIAWREDPSNQDVRFLRNRVRHELIPLLESRFNPGIRETLHRTAGLLREEDRWLEMSLEPAWERIRASGADALDGRLMHDLPLPIRYRMILRWLQRKGVAPPDITYDLIRRIDELMTKPRGTRRISLTDGRALVSSYGCLGVEQAPGAIEPRRFREPVRVPGETLLPEQGLRIQTDYDEGWKRPRRTSCGTLPAAGWLDRAALGRARLTVRSWQAGDRIALPGMKGTKKLQDLFVDEKVQRYRRMTIPLLECRKHIVWIPGYRVARGWEVREVGAPSIRIRIERI